MDVTPNLLKVRFPGRGCEVMPPLPHAKLHHPLFLRDDEAAAQGFVFNCF
jgi:hypothetical protein